MDSELTCLFLEVPVGEEIPSGAVQAHDGFDPVRQCCGLSESTFADQLGSLKTRVRGLTHGDVSDVASGGRPAHCDPGRVESHRFRGKGIVELVRDKVESVSDIVDDAVRRVRPEEGVLERDLERVVRALSAILMIVAPWTPKGHVRLKCLLREPVLHVARVASGCELVRSGCSKL